MSGKNQFGNACNSENERQKEDFYATRPEAVECLLEKEMFNNNIWEPACGNGRISKVFEKHGYKVISSDKYDQGYGKVGLDFLTIKDKKFDIDIVTNPPYNIAQEFIEQSINLTSEGNKIAMFLNIRFLEGIKRKKFFEKYKPVKIYVASKRFVCDKNGIRFTDATMTSYAWFIWINGQFNNLPQLDWIN
jgi:hypothetical protein